MTWEDPADSLPKRSGRVIEVPAGGKGGWHVGEGLQTIKGFDTNPGNGYVCLLGVFQSHEVCDLLRLWFRTQPAHPHWSVCAWQSWAWR